jgi:hypothetical protein
MGAALRSIKKKIIDNQTDHFMEVLIATTIPTSERGRRRRRASTLSSERRRGRRMRGSRRGRKPLLESLFQQKGCWARALQVLLLLLLLLARCLNHGRYS